MTSGKVTNKLTRLFALAVLPFIACGSAPSVREYIIDVQAQMLRASNEKEDEPLTVCEKTFVCYAYKDHDVRKIKKYIVELEEQLKACQKKP